jgi:hypothetical protein
MVHYKYSRDTVRQFKGDAQKALAQVARAQGAYMRWASRRWAVA